MAVAHAHVSSDTLVRATPYRHAWPVAMLLTTCFTLSYIDRQIISLLVQPIKDTLGLSDTQLGLLQGVSFSLFYVVATLPLARLADRRSRPKIMGWCIAAWSVMTMLCGFASHFWHLMLARIGVAVGEAGMPPAAMTMLADIFDPKSLARATAIFMLAPFIGGGIALFGGGLLYGWLETVDLSALPVLGGMENWQLVFIVVGAPGLIASAMVFFVVEPRDAMPPRALPDDIGKKSGKASGKSKLAKFILTEWRVCVLYMLGTAMIVVLFNAHMSWMPAAIMRAHGLDELRTGALFGPIYLFAGGAGTLVAGAVIGRSAGDMAGRTMRFMVRCAMLLLPMAIVAPLIGDLWLQLAAIAAAIFLTSAIVGLAALPFQFIAPRDLRAQCLALLGLVSALIGTGCGPLLVGVFSDYVLAHTAQPLSSALATVGGLTVGAAILLLGLAGRGHKARRLDLSH